MEINVLRQIREKIPLTYLEAFKTIDSSDGISVQITSHSVEYYTVRISFDFRRGAKKEDGHNVIQIIKNLRITKWKSYEWYPGDCVLKIDLML